MTELVGRIQKATKAARDAAENALNKSQEFVAGARSAAQTLGTTSGEGTAAVGAIASQTRNLVDSAFGTWGQFRTASREARIAAARSPRTDIPDGVVPQGDIHMDPYEARAAQDSIALDQAEEALAQLLAEQERATAAPPNPQDFLPDWPGGYDPSPGPDGVPPPPPPPVWVSPDTPRQLRPTRRTRTAGTPAPVPVPPPAPSYPPAPVPAYGPPLPPAPTYGLPPVPGSYPPLGGDPGTYPPPPLGFPPEASPVIGPVPYELNNPQSMLDDLNRHLGESGGYRERFNVPPEVLRDYLETSTLFGPNITINQLDLQIKGSTLVVSGDLEGERAGLRGGANVTSLRLGVDTSGRIYVTEKPQFTLSGAAGMMRGAITRTMNDIGNRLPNLIAQQTPGWQVGGFRIDGDRIGIDMQRIPLVPPPPAPVPPPSAGGPTTPADHLHNPVGPGTARPADAVLSPRPRSTTEMLTQAWDSRPGWMGGRGRTTTGAPAAPAQPTSPVTGGSTGPDTRSTSSPVYTTAHLSDEERRILYGPPQAIEPAPEPAPDGPDTTSHAAVEAATRQLPHLEALRQEADDGEQGTGDWRNQL